MRKLNKIVEQAVPPTNRSGSGPVPPANRTGGGPQPPVNRTGGGPQPPTNTGGGGAAQTTTLNPIFSCISKAEGANLKETSSKNQVRIKFANGKSHFFWVNGHFQDQEVDKTIGYKGKWKCDGGDNYIIETTDGDKYSSKTGEWTGVPSERPSSGNGNSQPTQTRTTFTDTNLTDADIKAGKIVKLGMKGDIVGKIQDLLINKGFKRISKTGLTDNTFGNRTKRMVQAFQAWAGLNDDGAVGPKTWAALNDASSGSATTTTTTTNTQPGKSPEVVPGTDLDVMEESLKKKLRKNLEIYI